MPQTKGHILVVDDDISLLELLVDTLTTIGYEAVAAAGGQEALNILKSRPFDLIISDIKMPEMDGLALLKQVRRFYPDLPVLFITGVASHDIIGSASPDGFLAKPFRISHIEELIEDTLADRTDQIKKPIKRVMVVDDDDLYRSMLVEALRYSDYIPISFDSGEQALKQIEDNQIDAVITDIKMPGMSGLTLMEKIKARYPEMPVILITAFIAEDDDQDKRYDSADGLLEKPFRVETIVQLLDDLVVAPSANTNSN